MAENLDPRVTPRRANLGAVKGILREIRIGVAPLRQEPSENATQVTEALRGERVTIYDERDGWGWGQLAGDGYVGWIATSALADPGPAPTHRIKALTTLAFPGPSIKLPPIAHLPLGSRITVVGNKDSFAITHDGWHIPMRHLAALGQHESDLVAVAERFMEAPYLWGGKTAAGLDCSGLVQIALDACGITCPRDSDMQERALGQKLPDGAPLRRGDLIFWKGHVAIARDAETMVHANAFHMSVAIETIADGIARIAQGGSAVTGIRRL